MGCGGQGATKKALCKDDDGDNENQEAIPRDGLINLTLDDEPQELKDVDDLDDIINNARAKDQVTVVQFDELKQQRELVKMIQQQLPKHTLVLFYHLSTRQRLLLQDTAADFFMNQDLVVGGQFQRVIIQMASGNILQNQTTQYLSRFGFNNCINILNNANIVQNKKSMVYKAKRDTLWQKLEQVCGRVRDVQLRLQELSFSNSEGQFFHKQCRQFHGLQRQLRLIQELLSLGDDARRKFFTMDRKCRYKLSSNDMRIQGYNGALLQQYDENKSGYLEPLEFQKLYLEKIVVEQQGEACSNGGSKALHHDAGQRAQDQVKDAVSECCTDQVDARFTYPAGEQLEQPQLASEQFSYQGSVMVQPALECASPLVQQETKPAPQGDGRQQQLANAYLTVEDIGDGNAIQSSDMYGRQRMGVDNHPVSGHMTEEWQTESVRNGSQIENYNELQSVQ